MVTSFKELSVYQRSYAAALEIHKLSLEFPQIEQYALANQMRRSSKSICANIAEGFAKHHASAAEFKRFLMIAIGSSDEMLVWLEFCKDLGYLAPELQNKFTQEYQEISRMIFSLSRNWKN